MIKYFYIFMETVMFKIHNWWHRDIFGNYTVFNEMCFDKDVSKHQEERDKFRSLLNLTTEHLRRYNNVQLVKVYHHTIEKDIERSKKVLENEPSPSIREWFEKNLENPTEHWEYEGVNYFHNTLTDRIRRYFQWTCMPVPSHLRKKNWQDKNFISRHWIDVCDFIERSQAFFSRY